MLVVYVSYNPASEHIFFVDKLIAFQLTMNWYIQGDSEGICNTLGNYSMSDSKQKGSYEHGSDFERLRSYDRLKLGIEGNDY